MRIVWFVTVSIRRKVSATRRVSKMAFKIHSRMSLHRVSEQKVPATDKKAYWEEMDRLFEEISALDYGILKNPHIRV